MLIHLTHAEHDETLSTRIEGRKTPTKISRRRNPSSRQVSGEDKQVEVRPSRSAAELIGTVEGMRMR